ncbi:MAG: hypothetical protein AAFZ18_07130 [Myxococcota bacterium]
MAYTSRPHALLLGLAVAGLLASCGGDDDAAPDAGTPATDAGMGGTDGGMTGDDMGTDDAGAADSGAPAACNPVDGSGCPTDEFCVLLFNTGEGQCRTLPDQKAFGATCDPALQDCGPGLSCLQFQGQPEATCLQTCTAGSGGVECANVPDMSRVYSCTVTPNVPNPTYGACVGNNGAPCNPLDMMSCPGGEVCSVVQGTVNTACAMAGGAMLGENCNVGNCAEGQGICMNFTGDPLCYEPCNPAQPACSQNAYRCVTPTLGMMSFNFGVCVPPAAGACNPFNNPCPAGQSCSINATRNNIECRAEGMVAQGGDCTTDNCGPGLFCTPIEGGGAVCLQPCDLLGTPMCPMDQTCQAFGFDFGVCN